MVKNYINLVIVLSIGLLMSCGKNNIEKQKTLQKECSYDIRDPISVEYVGRKPSLYDNLTFNNVTFNNNKPWKEKHDKYNRPINVIFSPVLTYEEMQDLLNKMGLKTEDEWFKKGKGGSFVTDWYILDVSLGSDGWTMELTDVTLQHIIDKRKKIRKYNYPSIMEYESDNSGLLSSGLWSIVDGNGWEFIRGPKGELWKHLSPVITYAELKSQLIFNDDDVKYDLSKEERVENEIARVVGDVYDCRILSEDKLSVPLKETDKVKAILIDPEADASIKAYKENPIEDIIINVLKEY